MESNKEAYNRWKVDVDRYNEPHLRLRIISQIVNDIRPQKVVDLGCARGTLKQLLNSDISYTGVDFISPVEEINFPFYKCDFNAENLPAEIKNSEMVVCSGLIEYIENVPGFIDKIFGVVKKDGYLIASYFNMNHVNRRIQKIKGEKVYFHPDWRGNYSYNKIKAIFKNSGFKIVKTYPMGNSFSHSVPVNSTINDAAVLAKFNWLSPHMAHQFIFVLKKV